jgi:hypothetical protein
MPDLIKMLDLCSEILSNNSNYRRERAEFAERDGPNNNRWGYSRTVL